MRLNTANKQHSFSISKQTHNYQHIKRLNRGMLGIISKNTILKAIHNTIAALQLVCLLGIISKNTILKAIHNGKTVKL